MEWQPCWILSITISVKEPNTNHSVLIWLGQSHSESDHCSFNRPQQKPLSAHRQPSTAKLTRYYSRTQRSNLRGVRLPISIRSAATDLWKAVRCTILLHFLLNICTSIILLIFFNWFVSFHLYFLLPLYIILLSLCTIMGYINKHKANSLCAFYQLMCFLKQVEW